MYEDVCIVINQTYFTQRYDKPQIFATEKKDEAIRLNSFSWGVHSMLGEMMFDKYAFVGGAVYNEDLTYQVIMGKSEGFL